MKLDRSLLAALALAGASAAHATPGFVNGLALPATLLDLSGGTSVNNGRVGFFSDIYFDPNRSEWWGLSDRGPGGGTLDYATRVQRFTIDFNSGTGAISNFQIAETVIFKDANGVAFNGKAPAPANVLGNAFDPEGRGLSLIPGVLQAYKVSAADLATYAAPVPEPETVALLGAGLGLLGWTALRRQRGV